MCWSPQRGTVNKASIHQRCHHSQNGETVHTPLHAVYHTVISLHFPPLHPSEFCPGRPSVSVTLSPGTNIGRFGRPSSTWFSQLRWPNTLNTSTNLSTASTNHWRRWRRTGWASKRHHNAFSRSICVEAALLILASCCVTRCQSVGIEQRESSSGNVRAFEFVILCSGTVTSREFDHLEGASLCVRGMPYIWELFIFSPVYIPWVVMASKADSLTVSSVFGATCFVIQSVLAFVINSSDLTCKTNIQQNLTDSFNYEAYSVRVMWPCAAHTQTHTHVRTHTVGPLTVSRWPAMRS